MKKSDVDYLYEWASRTDFPLRRAPTAVGYSNKDIHFCWIKAIYRNGSIGGVRKSVVEDEKAQQILDQEEVIFATISVFDAGTKLNPHRDPPVYGRKYIGEYKYHYTYHLINVTWYGKVKKFFGKRVNLKFMMLWITSMRDIISQMIL